MKQLDVEVSATISMNYDPESEEFKDSLESYRDAIEDGASEEDMLRQIACAFGKVINRNSLIGFSNSYL